MNLEHKLVKAKDCTGIQINERKDMKVKDKLNEQKQSIVTTLKGIRHAALTISLVVVTAFAVWGIYNVELRTEYRYIISAATAVMILFSGSLVVEVLKRIGKE